MDGYERSVQWLMGFSGESSPADHLTEAAKKHIAAGLGRSNELMSFAKAKIYSTCDTRSGFLVSERAREIWFEAALEAIYAEVRPLVEEFRAAGVSEDDVGGWACFAIMKAAERFDLHPTSVNAAWYRVVDSSVSHRTIEDSASAPTESQQGGAETTAAKARRRFQAIDPLLQARGWTVYRWEQVAVVSKNTAYTYLSGHTTPRRDTGAKLAKAIGLDKLPR